MRPVALPSASEVLVAVVVGGALFLPRAEATTVGSGISAGAVCSITPDTNGHVDIPAGTTSIANNAFRDCAALVSLTVDKQLAAKYRDMQCLLPVEEIQVLDSSWLGRFVYRIMFCYSILFTFK